MTDYTLHDAPPPKSTAAHERSYFPQDMLDFLRQHPGKWVLGGNANNTSQANYWRKRLTPEGFTIVTRKRKDDGTHDYWISYGDPDVVRPEGGDDK